MDGFHHWNLTLSLLRDPISTVPTWLSKVPSSRESGQRHRGTSGIRRRKLTTQPLDISNPYPTRPVRRPGSDRRAPSVTQRAFLFQDRHPEFPSLSPEEIGVVILLRVRYGTFPWESQRTRLCLFLINKESIARD